MRRDRRRHRRQLAARLARRARLDRSRPDRQGAVPESGRLDRPRVELHLPGRPLEGDDAAHARLDEAVPRGGHAARVRRHRGRAHRGADGGAAAADGVGEVVGRRRLPARDAGGDQGARPVRRRVDPARRLLLAVGRSRRLAPLRDDHAREGAGEGRAGPREHRGARYRRRRTVGSGACARRAATSRPTSS